MTEQEIRELVAGQADGDYLALTGAGRRVIRICLGDDKTAIENSDLFARNYRKKLPRQTSQVFFSIGSIYERQQRWLQVITHYREYLKKYGLPFLYWDLMLKGLA